MLNMDVTALHRSVRAGDLPLEQLTSNPCLSEADKVAEVSRQFEAVLLRQILQEGQKTVFPSKLAKDSTVNSIYRDLVVDQLADGISRAGTFGLARSLQSEVGRQVLRASEPQEQAKPQEQDQTQTRIQSPDDIYHD